MESWQIYHIAMKKLPPGRLQQIYSRSCRLVTYWAANPRYCNETKRNPLDRIRIMLEELDAAGYGDYARAAVDYISEPLGGEFSCSKTAESDKGNVDGEAADLSVAAGTLIGGIREALEDGKIDTAERISIKQWARDTIKEIDELLDAAGMNE